MKIEGDVRVGVVRKARPWVTAWPVRGLAVTVEGDGFFALEAGGRVLYFAWEGEGQPTEVAPALPYEHPQGFLNASPPTDYGNSRIIALPGARVARFVSTQVRHVRDATESLLEVWHVDGRRERYLHVWGVCPVLLDVDPEGGRAKVGWPGRYAADPWPSLWLPLSDDLAVSGKVPIDLQARWSTESDAGDARRHLESERAAASSMPVLSPVLLQQIGVAPTAWASDHCAGCTVVAGNDRLAVRRNEIDVWVCGQSPAREADAFPRFEFEALREHLPEPLTTADGRWTLCVGRDWEMTDAYCSADFWYVSVEPTAAGERSVIRLPQQPVAWAGERSVIRLPRQPVAWAGEPLAGCVLLRDARGGWMCVDVDRRSCSRLGARIALASARPVVARRATERSDSPMECVDLGSGEPVATFACERAELPLALSDQAEWLLLQSGSSVRVVRAGDGASLARLTWVADEADHASWRDGGFVVSTRRGSEITIELPESALSVACR